ncbi:Crp/Fnr family transcriptional regulator [Fluviicola sp.]|uniref:Crp/Fnr family transcriptional regulator n=1 Tax=Fluviicola sp. TaxID=1917219 RepID=UPI0031E46CA8
MQTVPVDAIFKEVVLSASEQEVIGSTFEEIPVKKGDILLHAGQSVPAQYYVFSGCLRTFYLTEAGKDITLQFAVSDWWISDYTAFFTGGKALLNIECVQNAVVYRITRENMEDLYSKIPSVESFFRVKMERFFASFQKRILSDLAMTAKEKYLTFLKTYPNIEANIKNYHLASYLGITPESLSRLRAELAYE